MLAGAFEDEQGDVVVLRRGADEVRLLEADDVAVFVSPHLPTSGALLTSTVAISLPSKPRTPAAQVRAV